MRDEKSEAKELLDYAMHAIYPTLAGYANWRDDRELREERWARAAEDARAFQLRMAKVRFYKGLNTLAKVDRMPKAFP